MTRGLYIGRFQPFHNGHLAVCRYIANECDELIIGIGSSQLSHEPEHPYTAGERILMITRAVAGLGIPVYVVPIPDVHRNAIWVSHVRSTVPPFDTVYSSNPLVIRLFLESGISVRSAPMVERGTLSGTHIRSCMAEGSAWESLIPPETAEVIRNIDGVSRIIDVRKNDK